MAEDVPVRVPDFDALLARLTALSRNHLIYFRREVGRVTVDDLYAGDLAAYHSMAANKDNSLHEFAEKHAEDLLDLGLTEKTLRQSILVFEVVQHLPEAIVQGLFFSHLVQLTSVPDVATRRLLAQAVVDNGWKTRDLKKAVAAIEDKKWIDADDTAPGLQPPEPEPEPEVILAPGRVITRYEKAAEDFDSLASHWDQIDVSKLSKRYRQRLLDSVRRVEAHTAAFKAKLEG